MELERKPILAPEGYARFPVLEETEQSVPTSSDELEEFRNLLRKIQVDPYVRFYRGAGPHHPERRIQMDFTPHEIRVLDALLRNYPGRTWW